MKRRRQVQSGSSNWLTTYSDMVTLLLCFFVLLFTFSNLDVQKFKSVLASFQGGSGILEGGNVIETPSIRDQEELDLEKLRDILEDYADSANLGEEITISINERGLTIRFADRVLFDPGKADLKPDAKEILNDVAEILQRNEFKDKLIKVEGHADTTPVSPKDGFPTNWELSTTRATNVLRFLVEEKGIEGGRISASGYSYYRPIAPNDTKENKAKNRRVDIVILKSSYEKYEP
ncbi:MAG: flagellar motor protein MotB [Tissierellia bacterium]|nr:flagellar motor protein MotB [Tissierellia bacterium]